VFRFVPSEICPRPICVDSMLPGMIFNQHGSGKLYDRLFQENFGRFRMRKQRFDLFAKFCIISTRVGYKLAAVLRLAFQRRVIEPLDLPPALGIHGRSEVVSQY
jgi:hypothetical protein